MKKALTIIFVMILSKSFAQDSLKVLDAMYHDFSIPDASAFSLLGVNPGKVTKPSSTKELAASLVNVASSGKTISPGLAMEWAPFMTFKNNMIRNDSTIKIYEDYKQYKQAQFARNFQISFGSIQDSLGSKVAIGLNFVAYDNSDPSVDENYFKSVYTAVREILYYDPEKYVKIQSAYASLRNEIFTGSLGIDLKKDSVFYSTAPLGTGNWDKLTSAGNKDSITKKDSIENIFIKGLGWQQDDKKVKIVDNLFDEYIKALNNYRTHKSQSRQTLQTSLKKIQEDYKKSHWNAGMLKFGIGNIWNSAENTWQGLKAQKFSSYGAVSFKVNTWGQGIGLLQYNYNYAADSINKSQFILGGRFLAGSSSIHGSVEAVYQNNTFRQLKNQALGMSDSSSFRSTVGIEFKMSEGLWLEFAIGVAGKASDFFKTASMLSLADLKYTFKKEARYKLQ